MYMNTAATPRPAFADRDQVYAPIIAERMAFPMPAHQQRVYDELKTDAQRKRYDDARASLIRAKIHDEHVRAGFWA